MISAPKMKIGSKDSIRISTLRLFAPILFSFFTFFSCSFIKISILAQPANLGASTNLPVKNLFFTVCSPLCCVFSLANTRFLRFPSVFDGRLLVINARKTNACFAVACFFARVSLANTRFLRFLSVFDGRLLVINARKTNACFAVACFSFAFIILYHFLSLLQQNSFFHSLIGVRMIRYL